MTTFRDKVFAATKTIPKGETRTYKQIAEMIGAPNASRAVGNALTTNRNKDVPCHRVIRSDGTFGGFAWGTKKKEAILRQEGAIH